MTIGVKPQAPAVPTNNPPTNGHSVTANGTTNHSVNNLTSNLATMSVKGGVTATAAAAAVPPPVPSVAPTKMDPAMMSNGNGHHVDSNKMHAEKMDHEKYQTPVVRAKPKELDGYVGFANLPNQVYRKAVKRGFDFTLMVVGE